MNKYLRGWVIFLAIASLFCGVKYEELRAKEVQSSFYIAGEREDKAVASFYIRERKEKRWKAKIGIIYSITNMEEVNDFIAGVNNWYLTELFEGVEWVGPPPYLDLGLSRVENIIGYQAEVIYLVSPEFGIGIGYEEQKGVVNSPFEGYWEGYSDSVLEQRWLEGHVSVDVSLAGSSLLMFLQRPSFIGDLDAFFYLGVGNYAGKINWEVSESWEAAADGIKWLPWENSWRAIGQGNTVGYQGGGGFSYPFGDNVCLFLNVGYQNIVVENLDYQETVNKGFEEIWINEMVEKPSNLDFSGIRGKFGLGLNL